MTSIEIYSPCTFSDKVIVPITNIGKNLDETILRILSNRIEGKCIDKGFVKPYSIEIDSYSSGKLERGIFIEFSVIVNCQVCNPKQGCIIECRAVNITKGGIRAESINENPTPIVIFISKDHNINHELFHSIKIDDIFKAKIIGTRFQLFDDYVSVIATIYKTKKE